VLSLREHVTSRLLDESHRVFLIRLAVEHVAPASAVIRGTSRGSLPHKYDPNVLPFTVLRDALFTHPTAAEGLTLLLADVASVD
jgi:hypothetical protein